MPGSVHLIPRSRLGWIPTHLRLAHEYSFFLHDEGARILVEYEGARAHNVTLNFRDDAQARKFNDIAEREDIVTAMRTCGFENEARRVVLNQTTMAMVSDSFHHIYEALRCLEKRKSIVALNLLRKPLTDSLLYLSWMLADEDDFYRNFLTNSPQGFKASIVKGRRIEILTGALARTEVEAVLEASFLDAALFSPTCDWGFQKLFQHAVHLITVERVEFRTTPESFNFIFKSHGDDDLYKLIYDILPHILLYFSHVILGLFEKIADPDQGGKSAFVARSIIGLYLVEGGDNEVDALRQLGPLTQVRCCGCTARLVMTAHNAARLVLTESFRCTKCRRTQPFPFSWIFD
ncbi:hypothetical protein [Sphingomonas sp. BK235]|uniref:hypothetical protein n=1 Tax=Sphingomonas sp. BK235 TaxID=2512131 RepID=UPI00104289EE|nr:hypothetical protein [Sphingomonas sp. BK235]TCP30396.1 hypothetical protein EV292_11369 [Sphingomonas sp. BK235]